MTEKTWTPRRVILHLLVGLVAGLLSGLFGVGGGVLIVPALVLMLGYGQRLAAGTSLAAIVPTATVGALSYGVTGNVAWIAALILAGGAVIGAQGGTWLLPRVPVRALQFAFVAFLAVVIVVLFLAIPDRGQPFETTVVTGIALAVLGLGTGVLSGLLGVGGGIVVVPALMLLFGASDLVARGTSLMMMIPAAISGTIGNMRWLNVNLIGAGLIGLAACTTTALGVWLARSIDPFVGSVVFAVFLTAVAAQLTVRAIRRPRS
ncbi:sulfite exporter TauE/SafE family protein [Cryobacterium algoritolerans]|uniref:Probable membrane transporter protein n=1 Tax=Cryobacterium algoritolerans TaxID=1259184 RepID=A0A4R8WUV3_9MICO|nr:sulfite exporter TauE/SafE family protein [Cryobacterium algoritolerans]TFC17404.1 sulfite exporter TauE/SafE family protein [Cryobacterium algoritolerans]